MSLDTAYDGDNIFAKIVRGDAPCVKLFEDDNTLAFLDVFPQSEGHSLVIHKSATATNVFDIDKSALGVLIGTVQHVGAGIKKALTPDGVRIAQFNGAAAGQTVFHLHFHIIPVYDGAPLGAHGQDGPVSAERLDPIAARIRSAL